jgi:hypothetical protein
MSSLMADFDVVLEISKASVEKMIRTRLVINNQNVLPPFEFSIPITVLGQSGTVHFMVMDDTSIQLVDLTTDERAVIGIGFTDTSVIVGNLIAAPLSGTVTISVKLRITSATETPPNALVADFADNSVTVNLDPASIAVLQAALAKVQPPISLSTQQFYDLASGTIHSFFLPYGPVALKSFSIDPNQPGDITTPGIANGARYVSLVNHNINHKALGLFGILFFGLPPRGDVSLKTETAIPPGEDFAVSLSPDTFHAFIFCPAAMAKLQASSAQMPGSCGNGGGVPSHGATVTSLADSFDNGHINVDGSVQKSGFCYTASSPFHLELTLPVNNHLLNPQLSAPQIDVTVDIDWYCALASAVVGGYIAGIIGAIAGDVIIHLVGQVVLAIRGITIPDLSLSQVPGPKLVAKMTLESASIFKEGLVLGGKLDIPPAFSGAIPQIGITWSVTTSEGPTEIGTGTYHYGCTSVITCIDCPSKDFTYHEYGQSQAFTLQASAILLGTPMKWEWWFQDTEKRIPLTSPSGVAKLKLIANYPLPLPSGTNVAESVTIGYMVDSDTVTSRRIIGGGNWVFGVYLRGTDPTGISLETFALVQIQHEVIDLGKCYDDYMKGCARNRYGRLIRILTTPQEVPPEGNWNPEGIYSLIQDVAALGGVVQEEVLVQASLRFGPQILAVFSKGISGQVNVTGK